MLWHKIEKDSRTIAKRLDIFDKSTLMIMTDWAERMGIQQDRLLNKIELN